MNLIRKRELFGGKVFSFLKCTWIKMREMNEKAKAKAKAKERLTLS